MVFLYCAPFWPWSIKKETCLGPSDVQPKRETIGFLIWSYIAHMCTREKVFLLLFMDSDNLQFCALYRKTLRFVLIGSNICCAKLREIPCPSSLLIFSKSQSHIFFSSVCLVCPLFVCLMWSLFGPFLPSQKLVLWILFPILYHWLFYILSCTEYLTTITFSLIMINEKKNFSVCEILEIWFLTVLGKSIQQVKAFKYLDFNFQYKLSWAYHHASGVKTAKSMVRLFIYGRILTHWLLYIDLTMSVKSNIII